MGTSGKPLDDATIKKHLDAFNRAIADVEGDLRAFATDGKTGNFFSYIGASIDAHKITNELDDVKKAINSILNKVNRDKNHEKTGMLTVGGGAVAAAAIIGTGMHFKPEIDKGLAHFQPEQHANLPPNAALSNPTNDGQYHVDSNVYASTLGGQAADEQSAQHHKKLKKFEHRIKRERPASHEKKILAELEARADEKPTLDRN